MPEIFLIFVTHEIVNHGNTDCTGYLISIMNLDQLKNGLDQEQYKAVTTTEGPILVLAGAGSGKTRVITYRILYLLEKKKINASNILAVTFTNKAANEMKKRISQYRGNPVRNLIISTFHSLGVRILENHITVLGYKEKFSIYDENDKKNVIKSILKEFEISDDDNYDINNIIKLISMAKTTRGGSDIFNKTENPEEAFTLNKIYERYKEILKNMNVVDFDDLIALPVQILKKYKKIRDSYQQKFKYIMVDEYQDTNNIQYTFLKQLISPLRNICVVGDDDQAIYGFRGSEIEHILKFENHFPKAKVITLRYNYRSTPTIVKAAGALIKKNKTRHEKSIKTVKRDGDKISINGIENEKSEAGMVVTKIMNYYTIDKLNFKDMAILYRTNFQSRVFEEELRGRNIPYRLIGGYQFFERKEIKDILAYMKFIISEKDEISLLRIINCPKRGIGDKTIKALNDFSIEYKITLYEAIERVSEIESINLKTQSKLNSFHDLIEKYKINFLKSKAPLYITANHMVKEMDYESELRNDLKDDYLVSRRMMNISELISSIKNFEDDQKESGEKPTLFNYLNKISLMTREDENEEENDNKVTLMTFHLSKGLEFGTVFLVGIENEVIPHLKTIQEGSSREEERRLFYVGMTRAKDRLNLSYCRTRKKFGETKDQDPSEFMEEIPQEYVDRPMPGEKAKDSKAFSAFQEMKNKLASGSNKQVY